MSSYNYKYRKKMIFLSAADLTKHMLAEGLKKMMQTTPLSKISVGSISNFCKISRNTFYYHFKDKYDLVNWIFYTEITPQISNISDLAHWSEGLTALFLYIQENRGFYINALRTEGQNSFSECLMFFYQNLIKNMLAEVNSDLQLSPFEIDVISRFYAHSLIGLVLDWAKDGMEADPTPTVHIIENLINGNVFQKAISAKGIRTTKS